jgi:predicted membrane protein
MDRDNLRGFAIVIAIAAVATVFFEVSSTIFSAILGAISLIFICLLWYFGYGWYHRNRMAISLMPDQQRAILYGGLGAVTVSGALYSLAQFNLINLGGFEVILVVAFFGGLFAIYYAWTESKRYYL